MYDPDRTPDTPRSRKIFWIKLLSAMAVILAGTFVLYRVVAIRALNQRVEAVRASGYPIEPEELNAWYPVPEGENAADMYERAFRATPADDKSEGVPFVSTIPGYVPGQPLDEEMAARIEAFLTQHADMLALLEEAARIEGSRFPGDYKEGINLLLPHLGQMRRGARILKVQSIYDLHLGEHDRAIDRCITILAMSRAFEREPILITGLVNISIQMLAYEQIELLIATGRVSDAKLQELALTIEPIDMDRMMLRTMVGERCIGHAAFNDAGLLAGWSPFGGKFGRAGLAAYRTAGLMDIDHSCYLDIMQAHIDYAENPMWPVPTALDEDESIPRICIMSRQLLPALSSAYNAFFKCEARRRTILTAIAAERYRQQHGSLPAQLSDLVPDYLDAVPEDPFTRDPLRYRVEDAGAIIYSIGSDNTDNDGRARDDEGNTMQDKTDIATTFGGLQEILWPLPEPEPEPEYGHGKMGEYGEPYPEVEETEAADPTDTQDAESTDADETPAAPPAKEETAPHIE